jgi:hypothetical protein
MTSASGSEPARGAAPGAGARIRRPPRNAEGADCDLFFDVRCTDARAFPPESAKSEGTSGRKRAAPPSGSRRPHPADLPRGQHPARPLPLPSWRC